MGVDRAESSQVSDVWLDPTNTACSSRGDDKAAMLWRDCEVSRSSSCTRCKRVRRAPETVFRRVIQRSRAATRTWGLPRVTGLVLRAVSRGGYTNWLLGELG